MNKPHACHYAIIRFCPYPETDEFVNVGVVLSCPELGFFDFKQARRQLARVDDFFPALPPRVYDDALGNLRATLEQLRKNAPVPAGGEPRAQASQVATQQRDAFLALVRPRETILHFSEPRVIMSMNPAATLGTLFGAYVERPRMAGGSAEKFGTPEVAFC